jgi:hypothetical protein
MRASLVVTLAAGCLQPADFFQTLRDAHADPDGDGWSAAQGDCAPHDPATAPNLPERCDRKDNDCDGQVDEDPRDAEAWFDGDRDGFGDAAVVVVSCEPPEGFVAAGAPDCDDDDARSHPGAPERCDEADNDCDGQVDEDPAEDAPTWYLDVDADGYGAATDALTTCTPPTEEWVLNGDDCAPEDPAIHPGQPEVCNGEDDDCDGLADNPPVSGDTLWYPDVDRDGFGDAAAEGLCAPEPGWVDNHLDCGDRDDEVKPGAVEVCNDGVDNDCSGVAEGCGWPAVVELEAAMSLRPADPSGYGFGSGLDLADIDGDGRAELLVAANASVNPGAGPDGALHVFGLPVETPLSSTDSTEWRAVDPNLRWFGADVAATDLNGDGLSDLVLSSVAASEDGVGEGAVFFAYGPLPAGGGVIEDHFDWMLYHNGDWTDFFGRTVEAIGDVSGDGRPDIAVGVSYYGRPTQTGALLVYSAFGSGTGGARREATTFITSPTADEVGWCAAGLDLNADGVGDLVVTAPYHRSNGAALVFLGPLPEGDLAPDAADITVLGRLSGSQFGEGCSAIGDPNGDGYPALALSADLDLRGWAGVFDEGLEPGTYAPTDATAQLLGTAAGSNGYFGASIHGVGDLNQDGVPDLAVGELQWDPLAARIWFGPFAGTEDDTDADITVRLPYTGESGYLRHIWGGQDLTGDTVPDLLVSDEVRAAGEVWLVPGVGF